jgi:hypothetical protein
MDYPHHTGFRFMVPAICFIEAKIAGKSTSQWKESRSVVIAAAGLTILHGGSPDQRLRCVVEHRPSDISPGLWVEVKAALERRQGRDA